MGNKMEKTVARQPQFLHMRTGDVAVHEQPVLSADAFTKTLQKNDAAHFIVTFKSVTEQAKEKVASIVGKELTQYLPDDSFVVYTTVSQANQIAALTEVSWVGNYKPAYKLDPTLQNAPTEQLVVIISSQKEDSKSIADRYSNALATEFGEGIVVASVSAEQLRVSCPSPQVAVNVAGWLAKQKETFWVEVHHKPVLFGNQGKKAPLQHI